MSQAAFAHASIREPAPAKINLALHVVGRRPDGFHLLESLAVFTGLGDSIEVRRAAADSFSVDGPFAAGIPTDEVNLVVKARNLLRDRASFPGGSADGKLEIRLNKNLPLSSGIGGGSSDAAAAMRALNRLDAANLSTTCLAKIGAALGADVPMCVHAVPLVARGIGHAIEPLQGFPSLPVVLVNPGVPVSTPTVFRSLSQPNNPPMPPLPARPDFEAVCGWLGAARNDLQTAATGLAPPVGGALDALGAAGAAFVRMSGSGATCFGLFPTAEKARQAASSIARSAPVWWVQATETAASPSPSDSSP